MANANNMLAHRLFIPEKVFGDYPLMAVSAVAIRQGAFEKNGRGKIFLTIKYSCSGEDLFKIETAADRPALVQFPGRTVWHPVDALNLNCKKQNAV